MRNIGIVSYNIHCNFTNYGSALQSWALSQSINNLGKENYQAKLVDYCPDILALYLQFVKIIKSLMIFIIINLIKLKKLILQKISIT